MMLQHIRRNLRLVVLCYGLVAIMVVHIVLVMMYVPKPHSNMSVGAI